MNTTNYTNNFETSVFPKLIRVLSIIPPKLVFLRPIINNPTQVLSYTPLSMEVKNEVYSGPPGLIQGSEKDFIDPKELGLASLLLLINLPLLTFIFWRKTLRGRKSHQLFINISIVHVVSAVNIIASNFSDMIDVPKHLIINNGLLIEMFEMLMVLSCERVMAIKYSFKYADVRKRHIVTLLVCTWILPFIYVIMGFSFWFSQEASLIFSTVLINAATITLGTTNYIIYKIAKTHDKFLKENAMVSTKAVKNVNTLKASYVCFAIVASFMVLWTPYCVLNITWLSELYDQKRDGDVFSQVVDFIAYLHGVVDPMFFIWLSQATKKEIRKMLNIIRYRSAKKHSEGSQQTDSTRST